VTDLSTAAGQVLGGRYRLERLRAERPAATLWRAVDEVLARPVAIKLVPLGSTKSEIRARASSIRAAVARAGRVVDPRLVKIFDVDTSDGLGYVVSEWVDAPTLGALVRDDLFAPEEATDLAAQVADVLARAARVEVAHGRLHPGNLLLLPHGTVKITDIEVGRVISGPADDRPLEQRLADDTAGIGGLLYAALTGYWPDQPSGGLPAAPRSGGRPCRPRQIRAAVPRELDAVVARLLDLPGAETRLDTPARAAAALGQQPRRSYGAERDAAAEDREPGRIRLWLARSIPVLALIGVALVAYLLGDALGRVPGNPTTIQGLATPSAAAGTPGYRAVPAAAVTVFDPFGSGSENPAEARLADDGDPSTAWYTHHYRGSPAFGGLKPGVGLLFDLGRTRRIRVVRVALVYPGASLQLRAAATAGSSLAGYPVAAASAGAGRLITLPVATVARYWLLWLTRLPAVPDGSYQEGVAEVGFFA
jgi:hypothetical protein